MKNGLKTGNFESLRETLQYSSPNENVCCTKYLQLGLLWISLFQNASRKSGLKLSLDIDLTETISSTKNKHKQIKHKKWGCDSLRNQLGKKTTKKWKKLNSFSLAELKRKNYRQFRTFLNLQSYSESQIFLVFGFKEVWIILDRMWLLTKLITERLTTKSVTGT